MGMDQTVTFPAAVPSWTAVQQLLASRGYPVQLRMIDDQLAFPDEMPQEPWRELRVGTPEGMVTVRRDGERLVFVTWGNADSAMRQAWNALTWAFAEAGGGEILTGEAVAVARSFREQAEMPVALRGD